MISRSIVKIDLIRRPEVVPDEFILYIAVVDEILDEMRELVESFGISYLSDHNNYDMVLYPHATYDPGELAKFLREQAYELASIQYFSTIDDRGD